MRTKLICLSFLIVGLIFISISCAPPAPKEYSAVMVTKIHSMTSYSKMYFAGKKWRMETEAAGRKSIMIVREDKKVAWMIMPETKMYMEMDMSEVERTTTGIAAKVPGELKRTKIGRENVNGILCDKFKVSYKQPGTDQSMEMYQWISADGIPVKTAALDGSWSSEIKSLKRGNQPASLFELPAGYKKFQIPGM